MRILTIVTLFLSIVALTFPSDEIYSQSVQSIYIADLHMIFQKSDAGEDAKFKLELKQKEMEKTLDKMREEIDLTKASLEQESMVVNDKTMQEKERNLRIKINDFKSLGVKFQEELDKLQQKLVSNIEKSIIKIIHEIGKSEGYSMVMNKSTVLYSDNVIDISDKVLSKYNVEYNKGKK